jgi:branched-chain amino acid transport system substrate-binding protein
MIRRSLVFGLLLAAAGLAGPAAAQNDKPILIGVNTAIQLQVGRDAVNAVKMAIDEINQKGGVNGRKLALTVADEGEAVSEGPKTGIAAVNKLTGEDKVDVLIGGYDSGVTLAELPHISRAKTIFLGIGSASPAIQAKVKEDYERNKYFFRVDPINSEKQAAGLNDYIKGKLKGEVG